MTKEQFGENFQAEVNTNMESETKRGKNLFGNNLCTLLVALFAACVMTACSGGPLDKLNELKNSILGEDTEQVDDEDEMDEDESDGKSSRDIAADEEESDEEGDFGELESALSIESTLIESIGIDSKDFSLPLGQTRQLKVNVQPQANDETVTWKSSDVRILTVDEETGVVKGVKEGSANVIAQTSQSGLTASVTVTITPAPVKNPNYGTVNLGYGTYTGDLKNGKPHGHGTIVYSTSHKVVNSADYYAVRGDKFEGDFRDGRISGGIGYFTHNGDVVAINP